MNLRPPRGSFAFGMLAGAAALMTLAGCGPGGELRLAKEEVARALNLGPEVGAICGDPRILGVELDPIGSSDGGCGIARAVEVHAVGPVLLSPSAQLNCPAASALKSWVEQDALPQSRANGSAMVQMRVAASYSCRRRNNRSDGALSDHAKGNAIDISAFTFADGRTATVDRDWSQGAFSGLMKQFHASACGPFGVVLGPEADRHHKDHFHFDISNLARRYCR